MNKFTPVSSPRQAAFNRVRKDMAISAPDTAKKLLLQFEAEFPLDDCHISRRALPEAECLPALDSGIVRVYANDLEVKRPGGKSGGGLRGKIVGWSDASRGRLLKKLNRLHWPAGATYFVGLTFPDEFPEATRAKSEFQALLKRIKRAYPGFEVLWRQEWKRRKSGMNAGKVAPHFHLFAWGIPGKIDDFFSWLRLAWTDIAGAADPVNHLEHGSDVRLVTDRQHASWYVSKYMSKSEDDAHVTGGRAWGYSSGLDFSWLWETRLTQVQLLVLRALIEDWLRRKGSAFLDKLSEYPVYVGYHVYGLLPDEVRTILERVAGHTIGISIVEQLIRATGGTEVVQAS